MVDVNRLRSKIVLSGHTQKSLVAEMCARGVKMSENTLSAKMTGRSQFCVDEVLVISDILGIDSGEEKANIFLA